MYKAKKVTTTSSSPQFKGSRRMIIGGQTHNVDSIETYNRIVSEVEEKKQRNIEKIEESKNQKVLVKTTMNGNTKRVTQIINDISRIPEKKQQQKTRPLISKNDDKKFVLVKTPRTPLSQLQQSFNINRFDNNKYQEDDNEDGYRQDDNLEDDWKRTKTMAIKDSDWDHPSQRSTPKSITKGTVNLVRPRGTSINKNKPKETLDRKDDELIDDTNNDEEYDKVEDKKPQKREIKTQGLNIVTKGARIKKLNDVNNPVSEPTKEYDSPKSTQIKEKEQEYEDTDTDQDGQYYTKSFAVQKGQWYIVQLKTNTSNGIIKFIDDSKQMLMPTIRTEDNGFMYSRNDNNKEFRICVLTGQKSKLLDVHILGLEVNDIKIQQIAFDVVLRNIDVWKFRKNGDLEIINYYMNKIKLNCSEKFVERFKADYELFKNPNFFEKHIKTIKLDKKLLKKSIIDSPILYLVGNSIEYEPNANSIRTHNIAKSSDNMIVVTRYGYPYEKDKHVYQNKPIEELTEIDGIKYVKLLNKDDNFSTNNNMDYIKKYMYYVLKLAMENNATEIRACSNYINGLVAVIVAKHLGIKSTYEVRSLASDSVMSKNSDLYKMVSKQESFVLQNCDNIIVSTDTMSNKLSELYDSNKIDVVYNMSEPMEVDNTLINKYNFDQLCVGYIGNATPTIIKLANDLSKLSIKFIMIGKGVPEMKNSLIVENVPYEDMDQYYGLFDVVLITKSENKSTGCFKLIEAMSYGKAVVAYNSEENKEILDGTNGILYTDIDLLDKIKYLVENPDKIEEIGENAKEWIKQNRSNTVYDREEDKQELEPQEDDDTVCDVDEE